MCVVQDWGFQRDRDVGGLSVQYQDNDSRNAKFDLILNIVDDGTDPRCSLTYATALFKRENCRAHRQALDELPAGDAAGAGAVDRQPGLP